MPPGISVPGLPSASPTRAQSPSAALAEAAMPATSAKPVSFAIPDMLALLPRLAWLKRPSPVACRITPRSVERGDCDRVEMRHPGGRGPQRDLAGIGKGLVLGGEPR